MKTDQLADFGTLVRLFRLLGQLDNIAPQNVEIAFEEIGRTLREEIHIRWEAEQAGFCIESLARRVASFTGCDVDLCRAAAAAASSPSRAKIALAALKGLLAELECAGV